jgi:hypothetical protein
MYRNNMVMVTLTTGIMFLLLTCMHFLVWGILRMWYTCAPTACEVVHYCLKPWSANHWWSTEVPQVVRGGPQAISEERAFQKLYLTLNECKIHVTCVC